MGKIVYTRELVRAIFEETKLNAHPGDNLSLYDLICDARTILRNPHSESVTPETIQDLEDELGRYTSSYAAAHRREELFILEAERIVRAQDIFKLERVAQLIHHLNGYKTPGALEYGHKLNDLMGIVQDAKSYAWGGKEFHEPKVNWLLDELKPYVSQSTEVSGLYRRLEEDKL